MRMFFLLFLLFGCSPSSMEDFRDQGREQVHELLQEMRKIHTRQDLVLAQPRLKMHFEKLTQVMIEAREYKENHPEAVILEPAEVDVSLSQELEQEMHRLLYLEGGEEILEKAQEEALYRLDHFEKVLNSRKQRERTRK